MALFRERLKELRIQSGMTQRQVAEQIGLNKQTVSQYELGKRSPDLEKFEMLCDLFNVAPGYMLGESDLTVRLLNSEELELLIKGGPRKIPVLGEVAAGTPIDAIESVSEYIEIPHSWAGEYGALKVKGDSMLPVIREGDIIIFRKQTTAQSGDLVVAMVDDHEATVKLFSKTRKGITLIPFNKAFEPLFFDKASAHRVQILGRVIENRQRF